MKNILCPIDFSESSKTGLEYAANLAKASKASLTLLYVRTSIWPEAIQLEHEKIESNEDIIARLELFSKTTHQEFGIPCFHHLESTSLTFEEAVASNAGHADLIVMGTHGADSYYTYLFGSHSVHVVEKSKCPVIIIPEHYSYKPIKLLVFAYDGKSDPNFLIEQINKLTIPFNANIKVVHVAKEKTDIEQNWRHSFLYKALTTKETKEIQWSFYTEYSYDTPRAINQFMQEHNADILALSFHHKSLLENLLEENTIRKISLTADYPLFIFS